MMVFGRPISSETMFMLTNILKTSNPIAIKEIFTLYLRVMGEAVRSKIAKPPEMLTSQGIHLCVILRYLSFSAAHDGLYVNGRHFLLLAWKAYYPYIPMFIVYFLIPCIVNNLDIEMPWRVEEATSSSSDSSPRMETNSPPRAPIKQYSAEDLLKINLIRQAVNSPPLGEEHLIAPTSPKQITSVIMKLIELCPLNSPERQSLSELRRVYTSGYNYYCTRLGLQQQKAELAIFLDNPLLLDGPLIEDDIQKALFMHSNTILKADVVFMPHHFDRAVRCLNYEMVKDIEPLADWVKAETLDELIFLCKETQHAICREMLLIVVKKNVTLCAHQIKRLPEGWREAVLQAYTTPRWKSINPAKPDATLDYYRTNLCHSGNSNAVIHTLQDLSVKLANPDTAVAFLKRINDTNRSFYALQLCSYDDIETIDKLTFVNQQDSDLHDVFDISRNFIFPYRVDNHLYLFDYKLVPSMLETKQNPFNRSELSIELVDEMTNRYHKYNGLGLGLGCTTMTDFVHELVYGRKVETICGCASNKSYLKKLARALRVYSIRIEMFDSIDLRDALFKLGLMGIEHGRPDSVQQLAANLYKLIKESEAPTQESLKQAISSIVSLYSR